VYGFNLSTSTAYWHCLQVGWGWGWG